MRTKSAIMAIAVLMVLVSAIAAQQSDTRKPAEPKYTEIKYEADMSSYKWDGDDRILVLKGNVKFVQGDTTLLADKVDYRESTRTANATGNLRITDDQSNTTADACIMSFKEKKCSLTGNVVMVAKPKPKAQNTSKEEKPKSLTSEWKDEATITCDKVDYFYKEKKGVISSPVKIVQKTRVVTADSATYLGKEEIVHLTGNVKGVDEKEKHTFSAPKVTISLKENDEWIEAEKATGSFYVKDEEEPVPAETTPAEKPAEQPAAKPGT